MSDQWTTTTTSLPTSVVLALIGAILEAGDAGDYSGKLRTAEHCGHMPKGKTVNFYLDRAEEYMRLAGERTA